jgi:hypothetical protein
MADMPSTREFRVGLGDGSQCRVEEVRPRVFVLRFADHYECCMHFLRYQECFESACGRFRGKRFRIFDYMRWYAGCSGGSFTYPDNWAGFNLKSTHVRRVFRIGIPDPNHYDVGMANIYFACSERARGARFYLIGGEESALRHEMAHALYYTSRRYHAATDALLRRAPARALKALWRWMQEAGYADAVLPDEAQAYLSTGLSKTLKIGRKEIQAARAPFVRLFREHEKL